VTVANATCLNFGSVMSLTRFPATPIARDGVDLMELEDVHSIGAGEHLRLAQKIRPGCRSVNTNVLVFSSTRPNPACPACRKDTAKKDLMKLQSGSREAEQSPIMNSVQKVSVLLVLR